jgi:hypothetical protein
MTAFHHTATTARGLATADAGVSLIERVEGLITGEAAKGFVTARLVLIGSAIAALFVALGYVIFGPEHQHEFFRDIGPVTAFATLMTFSVGFAGLMIARREHPEGLRRLLNFWFLAGAGFIVLSFDGPMDLHGRAGHLLDAHTRVAENLGFHGTGDAILAVYLLVGLAVAALYWRELLRFPLVLLHLAIGGAFIVGTIGIDGFGEHTSWMWVLEEEIEMIGLAFIAGAFAIRLNATNREDHAQRLKSDG